MIVMRKISYPTAIAVCAMVVVGCNQLQRPSDTVDKDTRNSRTTISPEPVPTALKENSVSPAEPRHTPQQASSEKPSLKDCSGTESCGNSQPVAASTQVKGMVVETARNSSNTQKISNGEWIITIGNLNSWSGVNNTGNLSYRGCDAKRNCVDLTGGRVSCRDGICTMGWQNGDYWYILEESMQNSDRPGTLGSATTLIVRKDLNVILRASGFKTISP